MDTTITNRIEIKASPERVFEAWVTPEQMIEWWGEDGLYHVTEWECDLRVGGKWVSRGVGHDGSTFTVHGEYIKVDRPHALSFTWNPDWDPTETTVELTFERTTNGTLLSVTHSGFSSGQSRDGHNEGWTRVLGWLRGYVEVPEAVK